MKRGGEKRAEVTAIYAIEPRTRFKMSLKCFTGRARCSSFYELQAICDPRQNLTGERARAPFSIVRYVYDALRFSSGGLGKRD